MTAPGSAVVVGGSLGGLFAANLLLRAGWDVHVYERAAEELEGRGAGIVAHPELLAALGQTGATVDESIGVRVMERVTLDSKGNRVASRAMPQVLTAWARLFNALKAAFPQDRYHTGKHLVGFSQDDCAATARFADGSTASGDILVAADGVRSSVRQTLLPSAKPQYAGYVAWRGLVDESDLSPAALIELFPYFAFGLPPGEQMLGYPVAGRNNAVEPGRRRYNFVWYRPAQETTTLRDMVTDANGKVWADGIPPPLIRPALLAATRLAASQVLAPQFAELVEKTQGLFFQPIFDLDSDRIAFGRIALLGDAAFVARPHCGMGVTKAASDALYLVQALQSVADPAQALAAYDSQRVPYGKAVVAHARHLGAYMQSQLLTAQERDMAERYRTQAAVMRETAVPFRSAPDSSAQASG